MAVAAFAAAIVAAVITTIAIAVIITIVATITAAITVAITAVSSQERQPSTAAVMTTDARGIKAVTETATATGIAMAGWFRLHGPEAVIPMATPAAVKKNK